MLVLLLLLLVPVLGWGLADHSAGEGPLLLPVLLLLAVIVLDWGRLACQLMRLAARPLMGGTAVAADTVAAAGARLGCLPANGDEPLLVLML